MPRAGSEGAGASSNCPPADESPRHPAAAKASSRTQRAVLRISPDTRAEGRGLLKRQEAVVKAGDAERQLVNVTRSGGGRHRSPALDGAVGAQRAGVVAARSHGLELTARCVEQPREVPAPALDGFVDAQPAGVASADGEIEEGPVRRLRPAVGVGAPAGHGPVGSQGAGMLASCRECGEAPVGRIRLAGLLVAPALDCSVDVKPASVVAADSDSDEGFLSRPSEHTAVASAECCGPAPHVARHTQCAGVARTGRHRDVLTVRDAVEPPEALHRLQVVVASPAFDSAAGAQPAGLVAARRHGGKWSFGGVGLPEAVGAPTFDAAAGAQPA